MNKNINDIIRQSACQSLLVGNGPSALFDVLGDIIDAFDGPIYRFNNCQITGYEKQVGTRTDYLILRSNLEDHYRYLIEITSRKQPRWFPTSGAVITDLLTRNRQIVWIHGFDFVDPQKKNHYADNEPTGWGHDYKKEKSFFDNLINRMKVRVLGDDL